MKKFTNFMKNEKGQGATEYILLLVVIVGLVIAFKKPITDMITGKIGQLQQSVNQVNP